jgi:hypothetical protein
VFGFAFRDKVSPSALGRDVSKAARFASLKASKPGRFAYTDKIFDLS